MSNNFRETNNIYMDCCSYLKALKYPQGLNKFPPSLVIKDLICKINGVHFISSKVFSSYNNPMVVTYD